MMGKAEHDAAAGSEPRSAKARAAWDISCIELGSESLYAVSCGSNTPEGTLQANICVLLPHGHACARMSINLLCGG